MRNAKVQHSFRWVVVGTILAILAAVFVFLAVNTSFVYGQCGGTIRSGSSVSSSISSGSRCDYVFDGARGNSVTIRMTRSSSTLDPFLELRGPRGQVVISDDDSAGDYNSLISNCTLPESGLYTVRARSYDSNGYGGFTLQFQMTSGASCGGPIPTNTWLNNQQIGARGQSCRYTFHGDQGRTVSIAMARQDQSLDPWLDLVDPSGNIVASDDDSYGGSDALIKDYRLRTRGQYTIVARSYNNGSAGAFSIYLKY